MASKYGNEHETDSNDEDSNSDSDDYLIVSHISRPKHGTRSNTDANLMNDIEIQMKANEQLRTKISKMDEKVMTSERKFQKEKTLLESTMKAELMEKDNNIEQARVEIEKMRHRNTELQEKIKKYENTIKVLETNEKELKSELASEDTKNKELIKSEARKTEDLKQRLQDLTTKLATQITEYNKVNETMERNTKELKYVKGGLNKLTNSLEESKEKEAKFALKLDNMEQDMKQILSAVQTLGTNPAHGLGQQYNKMNNDQKGTIKEEEGDSSPLSGAKNAGTDAKSSVSGQHQIDTPRSREKGTKFPPLTSRQSTSQGKPLWKYTTGPSNKK